MQITLNEEICKNFKTTFKFNYSICERLRREMFEEEQNERKTSMDQKEFLNLVSPIKNWNVN